MIFQKQRTIHLYIPGIFLFPTYFSQKLIKIHFTISFHIYFFWYTIFFPIRVWEDKAKHFFLSSSLGRSLWFVCAYFGKVDNFLWGVLLFLFLFSCAFYFHIKQIAIERFFTQWSFRFVYISITHFNLFIHFVYIFRGDGAVYVCLAGYVFLRINYWYTTNNMTERNKRVFLSAYNNSFSMHGDGDWEYQMRMHIEKTKRKQLFIVQCSQLIGIWSVKCYHLFGKHEASLLTFVLGVFCLHGHARIILIGI